MPQLQVGHIHRSLCVHKEIRVETSLASATTQVETYFYRSLCVHKGIRVETSLGNATAPGRDVFAQVTMSLCVYKEIRVETSLASATAPGRDVHPRVIMSLRVHNVFAGQGYVILLAYSVTGHPVYYSRVCLCPCSQGQIITLLGFRGCSSCRKVCLSLHFAGMGHVVPLV